MYFLRRDTIAKWIKNLPVIDLNTKGMRDSTHKFVIKILFI